MKLKVAVYKLFQLPSTLDQALYNIVGNRKRRVKYSFHL